MAVAAAGWYRRGAAAAEERVFELRYIHRWGGWAPLQPAVQQPAVRQGVVPAPAAVQCTTPPVVVAVQPGAVQPAAVQPAAVRSTAVGTLAY